MNWCWLRGHKWHYVSRTERFYITVGFIKSICAPQHADDIRTVLLYCCDKCGKFKEKELKGCYPEIAADELIRY